jgi:hypothetical protein
MENPIVQPKKSVIKMFEEYFVQNENKTEFTRLEIAEFLRTKKDFEENLIKSIFEDGHFYSKENINYSPQKYYDNIFGNKNDLLLPDQNVVVLATFSYKQKNDRYATRSIYKQIGYFSILTDVEMKKYEFTENFVLITKSKIIPYSEVTDWEYINEKILFAFFDVMKSNRIIPLNNRKLVKRFINVYMLFCNIGIVENYETRFTKNYLSGKEYNSFENQLKITELLDLSSKIACSSKSTFRELPQLNTFVIDATGCLYEKYNLAFNDLYGNFFEENSNSLFGINISQRDIDKISIESLTLTLNDVKKLENIFEQLHNEPIKHENLFNFHDCEFEFVQHKKEIPFNIHLDINNENEFRVNNNFFWLSKHYTYKHAINNNIIIDLISTNIDNIKQYLNNNKINPINGFMFYFGGNSTKEYQKYNIETESIENISSNIFFKHTDYKSNVPYLRLVNDYENYYYNKISGFLIDYKNDFEQKSDFYFLNTYYRRSHNPINFEKNFTIDDIPVLKIGKKYYHYHRNEYCIVIDETYNPFKFDSLKQNITVMYDAIIKNNGSFVITKMAIKYPMKNYLISKL